MTVSGFITTINRAIRRSKPPVTIDLDVFDIHNRRAAYIYIGNVVFMGRAANQGRVA